MAAALKENKKIREIRNGSTPNGSSLNGEANGELRESGLGVVGKIPWGTHLCQFYKTEKDLLDILVPYFAAGLENNEFCMWVTADPLSVEDAKNAMRKKMPDLDAYLKKGQIEIIPYDAWYTIKGGFDEERVLAGWVEKLNNALVKGYEGLRLTGNTFWLEKKDWRAFAGYEETINSVIGSYKMIAVCSYSLEKCNTPQVLDVMVNHGYALIKRDNRWDILESTKQKETELVSRQNLQRYLAYMTVAGGLGWVTNAKGEVVKDIPMFRAYTGQSYGEVQGWGWSRAVHPDDLEYTLRVWKKAVRTKSKYETEYRLLGKDGVYRYFLARGVPVKDENGKVREWMGTCIDITGRKMAERRLGVQNVISSVLMESDNVERALKKVLVAICDATRWGYGDAWLVDDSAKRLRYAAGWSKDDNKKIIDFKSTSKQFQFSFGQGLPGRIWKSKKAEFIPDVVKDANFPRAKFAEKADLHNAFAFPIIGRRGRVLGVVELLRKQSAELNEDFFSFFETASNQIGQFIERKKTEATLLRERDVMAAVLENSHAQIAYLDRDFNFLLVNSAYERGCGHSAAELIGKNHFDVFPGGDDLATFKKVRATGKPAEFKAKPSIYADRPEIGTTYWDWVLTPVQNSEKEVTNFVLSMVDVTDKVQKEELQRNFIAILGHELRNPLAPIMLSLDLIKDKAIDDPDIKETFDIIRHQTANLARLLTDLLDLSRIERGKIELQKRTVKLRSVVRRAVEAMRPATEKSNQKLKVFIPAETIEIVADPLRIEQILVNILSNASKYSDEGSHIEVRAERHGDNVFIAIHDQGVGIAPDALYRIFDLFHRDQSTGRGRGGLGIGLYLARQLARLHGGELFAHSAGLGKGSEFTVRLPVKINSGKRNGTVGEKNQKRGTKSAPANKGRVMIIEDNVTLANTMGKIVKTLGLEVSVNYDGPTALTRVQEFRPDIVLLDLSMPGMDGLEVARRIRQDRDIAGVRIIAVTGYGQESDKKEAKKAGFDYYVVKPVGVKDLAMVLSGDARKFKL